MFLPYNIFHILLSVSSYNANVFDKLLASVHTHTHTRARTRTHTIYPICIQQRLNMKQVNVILAVITQVLHKKQRTKLQVSQVTVSH